VTTNERQCWLVTSVTDRILVMLCTKHMSCTSRETTKDTQWPWHNLTWVSVGYMDIK